ncbi:MAG: DegT/DnrJ/EryC1/StrS family aminotransferase [Bacteroidia bacterium]|nr:DegT/DnrJ/EryC1/StrS family aminotransferase [Bacteroidia bacterium]
MKPIQMVDLVAQYQHNKAAMDEAVLGVLASAKFIGGPDVKAFSEELAAYIGVKHVIPCANGTDALQIAMMALDFKPGDEIIVPTFTYVSTAEVIALLRLTPVLVDVDPHTFNIDIAALEAAITPKTKAIVPVHLFGQSADMAPLLALAQRHNLYVIEDNAQAIGAYYTFPDGTRKRAGAMGVIGCTSFYPSKNLPCYGDGGAIFTDDDTLALKLRQTANHGQNELYKFARVGVNSRLDTLQAAILRINLANLDQYIARRQAVAARYDAAFAGHPNLTTPALAPYSTHVYHQYTLQVQGADRDALKAHLAQHQVPSMVYYPIPLHQQDAYRDPRYKDGDFPHSERLCATVISLPIHPELADDQVEHIIRSVSAFFA